MIKLKHTISKTNNKDKIYSEQNKGKGAFMQKLDTKESITDRRQENGKRQEKRNDWHVVQIEDTGFNGYFKYFSHLLTDKSS